MAGLVGAALECFDGLLKESRDFLAVRGAVCAGSGVLAWKGGSLSIHSDFGPPEQDKDVNQDFALAWVASNETANDGVRWAIALADGVTSSWLSENGAELACWTALASIAKNREGGGVGQKAIGAAAEALGIVGDLIERSSEEHRPEGEFISAWKYTLREGLLLQTTLSVGWLDENGIHLAFIGDGGALVQREEEPEQIERVGGLDTETNRVHAIGPRNRLIQELDVYRQFPFGCAVRLAMFTDGVGRGLHPRPENLLKELNGFCNRQENLARGLIDGWIAARPGAFSDNLSLAVVTERLQEAD